MEAGDRSPASVVYFVLQPQQWCSQQQSSHLRAKLILRPHPMLTRASVWPDGQQDSVMARTIPGTPLLSCIWATASSL